MGGGDEAIPRYQAPDVTRVINGDIVDNFYKQMRGGMLPEQKAMIEGKFGALKREGEQALRERFAGGGGAIGAQTDAISRLYSNNAQAQSESLLQGDSAARQQGLSNYLNVLGAAMGEAGSANQFNIGAYRAGEENDFDWGAILGGAAQGAGSAAGATCFCAAETYGSSSREFLTARNWANKNVSETVKRGYMKLSSFLIPVMRRSPMFKKYFRKLIGAPCLKGMKGRGNFILRSFVKLCEMLGNAKLSEREKQILKSVFDA